MSFTDYMYVSLPVICSLVYSTYSAFRLYRLISHLRTSCGRYREGPREEGGKKGERE